MKWLFILFLLVNVIYLGWELDRKAKIEKRSLGSAINIPISARKLQLIKELDVLPDARIREMNEQVDLLELPEQFVDLIENEDLVTDFSEIILNDNLESISTTACFRYGPMPEENIVSELYDWFRSRDVDARMHFNEEQSKKMFWIYLAPQQTRENALEIIQEMQAKKIGDYRIINRGDLENAISLGLYSSQEAVNNRLREFTEKGYVPVIVPYSDVSRFYWLDIKMNDLSIDESELFSGFPAKYQSVPINCDNISHQ